MHSKIWKPLAYFLKTTSSIYSGGGNGNLLQYSCLENAIDGEPGRLQSMGSPRVGHNLATTHTVVCYIHVILFISSVSLSCTSRFNLSFHPYKLCCYNFSL